jgi:hypothetical protein
MPLRAKEVIYYVTEFPGHGWAPHVRICFPEAGHYTQHEYYPEPTRARALSLARRKARAECDRRGSTHGFRRAYSFEIHKENDNATDRH